jgi:hypothetical protein
MGAEKMILQSKIKDFIIEIELYARQKLHNPVEVGELLQIVLQTGMRDPFEGLIFQAKILVRTQEIMKRIGPGAEGYENLSIEFQTGMNKAIGHIQALIKKAPHDVEQKFIDSFLEVQPENIHRLIELLSDLKWIKNYHIDGKLLPYETTSAAQNGFSSKAGKNKSYEREAAPLCQIRRSAFFALLLFILFLFIDPPVTILGWVLTLGIAAFLMYIVIQSHHMTRLPNS